MVHTRATKEAALDIIKGSAGHGRGRGQALLGNPPRPLVSIEQLLATQNDFMSMLVENEAWGRMPVSPPSLGHEHVIL
jgi:hypothetical protein